MEDCIETAKRGRAAFLQLRSAKKAEITCREQWQA